MAPAILPDLLLAIGLLSFFYAIDFPKSAVTILLSHAAFGTAFVVAASVTGQGTRKRTARPCGSQTRAPAARRPYAGARSL